LIRVSFFLMLSQKSDHTLLSVRKKDITIRSYNNMKKRLTLSFCWALFALWGLPGAAQNGSLYDAATIRQLLNGQYDNWQEKPAKWTSFTVSDQYTETKSGITHIYLQQTFANIPVDGYTLSLHLRDNKIQYVQDDFVHNLVIPFTEHTLDAATAIRKSLDNMPDLRIRSGASLPEGTKRNGSYYFDLPDQLAQPAKAQKIWTVVGDQLRPAWLTEVFPADQQAYWQLTIDARTGDVITKKDLVLHCTFSHINSGAVPHDHTHLTPILHSETIASGNTYRVFPAGVESPVHGSRALITTNGDPVASPIGWHNDGLISYSITRGNNTYTYADPSGLNMGTPASGGLGVFGPLNFDFPLNTSQNPATYRDAAITNAFFWTNSAHDFFYHYGFDEVSGNFQHSNLGNGGLGLDAVQTEVQDGSGENNASFFTPVDGLAPRMELHLWNQQGPSDILEVTGGPSLSADWIQGVAATFGQDISTDGTEGEIVVVASSPLAPDGTATQGCGTGFGVGLPPSNDVLGRYVLIDRGTCSFAEKIMGAQLGGAIGAIIVNDNPHAEPIAMGGEGTEGIIIPSVMISYHDGQQLKAAIDKGITTIRLTYRESPPPARDASLDQGIIWHEYGHGVSTRLTGGPGQACLGGDEQAGEGWSDFFALMTTMTEYDLADRGQRGRGIGNYLLHNQPHQTGLRPAPYARDMSVNPYTYSDLTKPEITVPHGVGFIFASALWDFTWSLIDLYGYDTDLIGGDGGNTRAIRLVIESLRLQPCNPTLVDSRDALLAADQLLYGGQHRCLIWRAFAARGLGFSAEAGSSGLGDERPAFDLPSDCNSEVVIRRSTGSLLLTNGQPFNIQYELTNTGGTKQRFVFFSEKIPQGLDIVDRGDLRFHRRKGLVFAWGRNLEAGERANWKMTARPDLPEATQVHTYETAEEGEQHWSAQPGLQPWSITTSDANSGNNSWFVTNPNHLSNQSLTLADPITPTQETQLVFWHRFDTEEGLDGGVVEMSTDGGLTWNDLGPLFTENGYNRQVLAIDNPLLGGLAFSGKSQGWIKSQVDLAPLAGQEVFIRFRFASDYLVPAKGWWVDDILIGDNPTFMEAEVALCNGDGTYAYHRNVHLVVEPDALSGTQFPAASMAEQNKKPGLYPNPVIDQARFYWPYKESASLRLVNAQGQTIRSWQSVPGSTTMNLSNLQDGIYWIQAMDGNQPFNQKIVVQKAR
jgi:extracellular elastinolytic metalloproteinase